MRLEAMYFEELSLQHYGKRGMAFHGWMAEFFKYAPGKGASIEVVYCNQVLDGTSKQDGLTVLALFEAVLMQIKIDHPQINNAILLSDNAHCYHSKIMVMLLGLVAKNSGINLEAVMHTETADGKGTLDAHFAVEKFRLKTWCAEGHDVATPLEAFDGLSTYGGSKNSFSQLCYIDRNKLTAIEAAVAPVVKQFGKVLKRANELEIAVEMQDDAAVPLTAKGWDTPTVNIKIKFRAWAHSLIGKGVEFTVDFGNGTVAVTGGDEHAAAGGDGK